ncbi:MAG: MoaD/ThiS family protein [Candidatus Binatia bacterium]
MRVQVRLFASLRKYLPPGGGGDTVTVDVPEGATVGDLAAALGIPREHARMAVVAGEQLDLSARLPADVEVNLFPPLAGGA